MRLSNLRKETRDEEVFLIADAESPNYSVTERAGLPGNTIWFSVPKKYGEYLTADRYDGFLLAALYAAMSYGEDIEIDGTVSDKLLHNITEYVVHILLAYSPMLKKIKITAKDTTDKIIESATHIGTGFSGGIDSFCTIYDRFVQEINPKFKIDTLINSNVGNYYGKSPAETDDIFRQAYKRLSGFPNFIGLPYIPVNSSMAYMYNLRWNFEKVHLLNTLASVLVMQGYFTKYYFASVCAYSELSDNIKYGKDFAIAGFCDIYICQFLSTETLQIIPDGQQYTRTQKTERISCYPPTYDFLEINVNHTNVLLNKNMRTLTALDTLGKLELYSKAFDLNEYKKHRFYIRCKQALKYNKDPFAKDNIDFARERGIKFPNRFAGAIYVYLREYSPKRILKAVYRRVMKKLRHE